MRLHKRLHSAARVLPRTGAALAIILGTACIPTRYTIVEGEPPPPSVVTDRIIAGVFATATYGEVETGRLAMEKAQDPRVRQFARIMVDDNTAQINVLTAALTSMYNTLEESPIARQLRDNVKQSVDALKLYSGADFDRTYLDNEIAMHRYLLKALDQAWVTLSYDDELEDLLEDVRPKVQQHLRLAEEIRGSLQ